MMSCRELIPAFSVPEPAIFIPIYQFCSVVLLKVVPMALTFTQPIFYENIYLFC